MGNMKRANRYSLTTALWSTLLCVCALLWEAPKSHAVACAPGSSAHAPLNVPDEWRHFLLPGAEKPSLFSQRSPGGLLVNSKGAASGIIWSRPIETHRLKGMSWNAAIKSSPMAIDLTDKGADDSPLRISLVFSDDVEALKKLRTQKTSHAMTSLFRHGGGGSMLVYAAVGPGSPNVEGSPLKSPYSSYIRLIPWRAVKTDAEQVKTASPIEDYAKAFDSPAPRWAVLILICDTDDMGQRAALHLHSLELCFD